MQCPQCAQPLPDGAYLCPHCGMVMPAESALPQTQEAATPESIDNAAAQLFASASPQSQQSANQVAASSAQPGFDQPEPSLQVDQASALPPQQPAAAATAAAAIPAFTQPVDADGAPLGQLTDPVSPSQAEGLYQQIQPMAQDGMAQPGIPMQLAQQAAPAQPSDPSQVAQPTFSQPEEKRPKKWIIPVAIAGALLLGGGAGAAWYVNDQAEKERAAEQAAWEASHQIVEPTVKVNAPGLDANSSRIPVRVTGTDLDGTKVNEADYLDNNGAGLELLPGSYEVEALGSPIASDGTIYHHDSAKVEVEIPEDANGSNANVMSSGSLELVPLDALEVTDDTIGDAVTWALEDSGCPVDAETLKAAAEQRRAAAQEAKAAEEEEARKAAEEEAARKAAEEEEARKAAEAANFHVSTDDFEFDIPEYWRNRVRWEASKASNGMDIVTVYPTGTAMNATAGNYLVKVAAVPITDQLNGGDYITRIAAYVEGENKRVQVTSVNWPVYLAEQQLRNQNFAATEQERELNDVLCDLCSGGADLPNYRDVAQSATDVAGISSTYGNPDMDFVANNLYPSISVKE